jgi:precorrin-6B methylase 2
MTEYECHQLQHDGRTFEFVTPPAEPAGPAHDRDAAELARQLFARLSPGDLVLEFGAGTGVLSILLAASGAKMMCFEDDTTRLSLLHENTRRNAVQGINAFSKVPAAEAALGMAPRLLVVGQSPYAHSCLRTAAAIVGEHKPLVCVAASALEEFSRTAHYLRGSGYFPKEHLGQATHVLFAHGTADLTDLSYQLMTGVQGAAAALRELRGDTWLERLARDMNQLTTSVDERLRQTRALIEEQLIHSRRLDAEVFGLVQRLDKQRPRTPQPTPPPPRLQPTPVRKLKKLVRDPRGFVKDSKHPLVRGLARVVK